MPLPYETKHLARSRELRSNMTPQEIGLWKAIRKKQVHGVQFYRQKPLGPYIADFYCARAKLVVEIDGGQHYQPAHRQADALRDEALEQLGLLVLRFSNREVDRNFEAVVGEIHRVVGERLGELESGRA